MGFDFDQSAYGALRSLITEQTRRVVFWTGAGLSAPAGVPNWTQLRELLTAELESKARTLNDSDSKLMRELATNARATRSPWDAFKVLKQGLGDTTYRETIRTALAPAQTATIPPIYECLWHLNVHGIINLNIDKLATRAFASVHAGKRTHTEFHSKAVGDHYHVLSSPHTPFIFNAHGTEDDVSSWVFTTSDLNWLLRNQQYKSFIQSVFSAFTVVFVGISADDIAVGGHLDNLKSLQVTTGTHFWITGRQDGSTEKWGEERGVRVIRYSNSDGKHSSLGDIFADLLKYSPTAEPISATPVAPSKSIVSPSGESGDSLPRPSELVAEEPELIRLFLNERAQQLLVEDTDVAYMKYMEFMKQYDRAILNAWYVTLDPPNNVVLDYTLCKHEARGAFGHVYKATDKDGRIVAVKILIEEIRREEDGLIAFRRGVGSMRILKERGVRGMVEYLEAAEIPAMVVMEWVDGENLRRAVESKSIASWKDIVTVGSELAEILHNAHSLPERVLHRDLRPANVMIDGLNRGRPWSVKVLDFDLSWHRGANDRTLVHSPGTTGYLAPEQIEKKEGVSTRHSSVDSFGLGMTLFFMISGRDPFPNQHRHSDWRETVVASAECRASDDWKSLPARMARLIMAATQEQQSMRPDMTAMKFELSRLLKVLSGKQASLDMLVEEIACRTEAFEGYAWNEDLVCASVERATGVKVELRANDTKRRITLTFRRAASEARKGIGKKQEATLREVRSVLNSAGWKVEQHQSINLEVNVVAHLDEGKAGHGIDKTSEVVDKVCRMLRFGF